MTNPMTPTEQDKELEICENCGEKCGASLPYGIDCNTELRSVIRKLTTSKVQNVSDAKYGFWHHLDASSLDKIMRLITVDRERVALEARIDELENNKWLPNEAKWIEQEADRIAELKAQQEEV